MESCHLHERRFGVASLDLTIANFSMYSHDEMPVFGRTIVVHDSTSTRSGCGVIGGAFGVVSATVNASMYPGFSQAATFPNVAAVASLSESSGVLVMKAVLSGLEPSVTGGIHIHTGFECSSDGAVTGGHYYAGLPGGDP